MRKKFVLVGALCSVLLLGLVNAAPERPAGTVSCLLSGSWRGEESGELLRFEPDRILSLEAGQLSVLGAEAYEDRSIRVRKYGRLQSWSFSVEKDRLRLEAVGRARTYLHLKTISPELELKPLSLGKPVELPGERVRQIQEELALRLKTDQAVRKDPARRSEMPAVGVDNTKYLRTLVQEVGWIDIGRFGEKASFAAVILVQHSMDLPLMIAASPMIERDYKHPGPNADLFALLYDRLQNDLGHKQRFGTQLGEDAQGQPMVIPLENVERVDEFRKELGLAPLAEYLAQASKVLYDGKPIRLPRPDE